MRDEKGRFTAIHGMRKSKIYGVWSSMKERCYNQKTKCYKNYGGKGIKICDEWLKDFQKFYDWAKDNGYKEGLTIDRIDNNKNYEPNNCRWVTIREQNRNYSRNHNITYNGETKCIADWADCFSINRATILWRIKSGKSLDEVFDKKDRRKKYETL